MPLINPKMDKIALGNIKCFKVIIMALHLEIVSRML